MTQHTIIVGAGSAGCVLAARLSERADRSVTLIEAGPDYRDLDALPPEIRTAVRPAFTHDWGYTSEPGAIGRPIPLARARLVGGCSATNGAMVARGEPADYDGWAARGNDGWSFAEMLPVFRALEDDADFDGRWHGRGGPVPIRRDAAGDLLPEHRAFLDACAALGHASVADFNEPGVVGAGVLPRNVVDGVRRSAALTHLAPARGRPNLDIRADTEVDRVEFEGARAVGVRAGGRLLRADRVVLAAGAFGSPAILLRSGVGPASELAALGIAVRIDLSGVGLNLVDHAILTTQFSPRRGPTPGPGCQAMLTARSAGCSSGFDLQVFPWSISLPSSGGGPALEIYVALMKPLSSGSLRLRSADPAAPPRIDLGLLSDPADLPPLRDGVRLARRLAATPALRSIVAEEIAPGPGIGDDDAELDAWIRRGVRTYFHPVGTCRMGPAPERGDVVDARGRVHGLENLYVADASVMPSIPSMNTNLPTLAVAERIAGWLAGA